MEPCLKDIQEHYREVGWHWPDKDANLVLKVLNALQANLNTARGVVPIPNGQAYVTVGNLLLPFTPSLAVFTVVQPSGGEQIWATLVASTLTTIGFTVTLNGSVPATGYFLNYIIF